MHERSVNERLPAKLRRTQNIAFLSLSQYPASRTGASFSGMPEGGIHRQINQSPLGGEAFFWR